MLFSTCLWEKIATQLRTELGQRRGHSYERRVDVGLGYIDKIPLVQYTDMNVHLPGGPSIRNRTEVGDAAIFFVQTHMQDGVEYPGIARGIVLQAKLASSHSKVPDVPAAKLDVKKAESTEKELALLSQWPEFDLYATSKSGNPLLQKCKLNPGQNQNPPHEAAWYIACPPSKPEQWPAYWVAGPPILGTSMKWTLGQILDAVVCDNQPTGQKMGLDFVFNRATCKNLDTDPYALSSKLVSTWDDLCHVVMSQCQARNLPNSLTGGSTQSRYRNTTLYSNAPIDKFLNVGRALLDRIARFLGLRRGMHVVIVRVRSIEGQARDSLGRDRHSP